eukprot:2731200-Amphidinium_carterae.1
MRQNVTILLSVGYPLGFKVGSLENVVPCADSEDCVVDHATTLYGYGKDLACAKFNQVLPVPVPKCVEK